MLLFLLKRYYNGSGQRLATEAFVAGKYASKSYVDSKIGSSASVVEAVTGSNYGYFKYGNGMMIQYGGTPTGAGTGQYGNVYYVNFPISFKSVRTVTVSGSSNHWDSTVAYSFSNSTITVHAQNRAGVSRIDYIAFGTWK